MRAFSQLVSNKKMSEIAEKIIVDDKASDAEDAGSHEEADPDVKDATNKKKKKKKKSKGENRPENDFSRKHGSHAVLIELSSVESLVMTGYSSGFNQYQWSKSLGFHGIVQQRSGKPFRLLISPFP